MTPEDRAMAILEDLRFLLDDEDKFRVLVQAIREIEEEAVQAFLTTPFDTPPDQMPAPLRRYLESPVPPMLSAGMTIEVMKREASG